MVGRTVGGHPLGVEAGVRGAGACVGSPGSPLPIVPLFWDRFEPASSVVPQIKAPGVGVFSDRIRALLEKVATFGEGKGNFNLNLVFFTRRVQIPFFKCEAFGTAKRASLAQPPLASMDHWTWESQ